MTAVAPPQAPGTAGAPRTSHLPVAVHGPAEHEGRLPALPQHPQPPALLKGDVPHALREGQPLSVDQLLPGRVEPEDVDHRNASHGQGEGGQGKPRACPEHKPGPSPALAATPRDPELEAPAEPLPVPEPQVDTRST